jgi:eukaryotic-like serine/threonine-protein kinase
VEPLIALGRKRDALTAARHADDIYQRRLDPTDMRFAIVLDNLASLYMLDGKPEQGLALLARAVKIREDALGPDHPDIAASWVDLAAANQDVRHLDVAADAYQRAIAIWTRALGPDHHDLARPLIGLADVELLRNAPERAVPLLERALAIREHTAGNPEQLAHARFLLARALRALDRDPARARALAEQARTYYAGVGSTKVVADIDAWQKGR